MDQNLKEKFYKSTVSIFVGFVLLFQALISLGPIVGVDIGTKYWPLLNYAMYSRSFQAGDTVNVYRPIEIVTADGQSRELSLEELDLQLWHYRMLGQDLERGNQDALDFLIGKVASPNMLNEIRIMSFPVVVTRAGPELKESEMLVQIFIEADRFVSR